MRKLILLSLITLSANAGITSGSYPNFAYSNFGGAETLSNTDNTISYAIENRHAIPLVYNNQYKSALKQIFAEAYALNSYSAKKLESQRLLGATKQAISEFVCDEFRFRHRMAESEGCSGFVNDDRVKQPMPFISGQRFEQGLAVHADDKRSRVSFEVSLPASNQVPLSHAFGAVHELGSFFGGLADSNSLILSLRMKAYNQTESGQRDSLIYPNDLVYFVVLPSARELAKQASQESAVNYAISQGKLLVVDSRK